jgi:uncharacterized membrane protein
MGKKATYYRKFLLLALLGFLLVVSFPSHHAAEYYADLTISVDPAGFVTIGGLTNYPNLTVQSTALYTSKQQSYWVLNITKTETFSEFVYDLTLPKGSSITYIRSSGSLRIEEEFGNLILRGFGENESFSLLIQYQLEKQQTSFLQENLVYLILLPAILLVSLLLIFFYRREKTTELIVPEIGEKQPLGELKGLNHRQKQIIQLLHERNIPLTQTDIQKELQIPKASVSRNIHGLERKGLIEKEQIGMSNLIRLKKP